ncbi:uncharacterized protein FIBRA_04097 [Fibroporia radiculosa]|uniref:Uncharacterized protein n=1 Tax=Fibroporia radiculosa TaxID=599839 RepID=J4I9Z5_9APHY|nr:uncharacterized protein FIBRA_04097 [Fibroporia radiculosa]CCM02021.1 predicted protein [Fibroporia radiculosa]
MEGIQSIDGKREEVSKLLGESKLDESLYLLKEDEAAFFKSQTGIQDDEALKQHIISVQTEAYKVYPYPCIRMFAFTSSQGYPGIASF